MFDITFEDIFAEKLPNLTLLALSADISDAPTCDALWNEVQTMASRIASSYEMSMVNNRPGIAATRAAYKALGKDPNRYRPSTEAMCRRIVRGDGLYRVSNVVDLVNLLSIASGHSIGAFDSDRIAGHTLRLGVGRESEPYEAVHRGPLNIAGLPVLRDDIGGIATPTSDNARTAIRPETTRHLFMVANIYGDEMTADELAEYASRLLTQYAAASGIEHRIFRPVPIDF